MPGQETFLRRLDGQLSRLSLWLSARRHGAWRDEPELRTRTETMRLDLERAQRSIQASLDSFRTDYDVPPPRFGLRRAELDAYRRHLATVSRLRPILSNLDDPRWEAAHEELARSEEEARRAVEPEGEAAAP